MRKLEGTSETGQAYRLGWGGPAGLLCPRIYARVIALVVILFLMACTPVKPTQLPGDFQFEGKPMLPVKLWIDWIDPPSDGRRPPGLLAGNIFEAVVDSLHIEGLAPGKTLRFDLRPNFHDGILVHIQLPAPAENWIPFRREDPVIVQVVDAPASGKAKARINISILRATDGWAIHVLEGQSVLPEPFPESLSLIPRQGKVGRLALGERNFCARVFDRHPMEMRRDGYDPISLMPGKPMEFELGIDMDGWVEVRDCLRSARGTCPGVEEGLWSCQALVALRPSDRVRPQEEGDFPEF